MVFLVYFLNKRMVNKPGLRVCNSLCGMLTLFRDFQRRNEGNFFEEKLHVHVDKSWTHLTLRGIRYRARAQYCSHFLCFFSVGSFSISLSQLLFSKQVPGCGAWTRLKQHANGCTSSLILMLAISFLFFMCFCFFSL